MLAAALDPAGHVVTRQVVCQPLLQLVGLARIEALADERAQIVAQRLCQLLLGYTRDVGILDDVPLIDIDLLVALGLLLPAHDEEHPCLSVGVHDAAHGYDVAGALRFNARGEFVEALLAERRACERTNLVSKAGTQAIHIEAGHLHGGDAGAFRDDRLLIGGLLRRHREQGDEQCNCSHARVESKE